jgi:hypothetical protein
MNHYNDGHYKRISKALAEKLFNDGRSIYIIARKMRPGGPFHMGMNIDNKNDETFASVINNFIYYNCSYETGYYPAFYLEHGRKLM